MTITTRPFSGLQFVCKLPWQPDDMAYVENVGIVCVKDGEQPLLVRMVDGQAVVSEIELTEEMVH